MEQTQNGQTETKPATPAKTAEALYNFATETLPVFWNSYNTSQRKIFGPLIHEGAKQLLDQQGVKDCLTEKQLERIYDNLSFAGTNQDEINVEKLLEAKDSNQDQKPPEAKDVTPDNIG